MAGQSARPLFALAVLVLVQAEAHHFLVLPSHLVVVAVVRIIREQSAARHHRQVILALGQTGVVAAELVKHLMDYPLTGHQLRPLQLHHLPDMATREETTNSLAVVAIEVALVVEEQVRKVDR